MRRVKMPKHSQQPLPAFTEDEVRRLLKACKDTRDTAMVLVLLDSGWRAHEFLDLEVGDVDMKSGAIDVLIACNPERVAGRGYGEPEAAVAPVVWGF